MFSRIQYHEPMIKLSDDQKRTLDLLLKWHANKKRPQIMTLGGYAGTGKTTLISLFRKELKKKKKDLTVLFCSYTGKATRVLKSKLEESKAVYSADRISTIHSLIYSPIVDKDERIVGWEKREKVDGDLIIVDEASMVDQDIWNDLVSYGIPILAVGDHGQLPPISGKFNLLEEPILRLEEIHRQARENPIIKLSIMARERGNVPYIPFGPKVVKLKRSSPEVQEQIGELLEDYNDETLVLCGYNRTRVKLNNHIRGVLGFETPTPQIGDTVVCLRNNHQEEIYNGMGGKIKSIEVEDDEWYFATIEMSDGHMYSGPIASRQFNAEKSLSYSEDRAKTIQGDLFDFGYALTVHKAQGSQAKRVILFEERFKQMDDEMWRRWLYTGVTRAAEELYIIG